MSNVMDQRRLLFWQKMMISDNICFVYLVQTDIEPV